MVNSTVRWQEQAPPYWPWYLQFLERTPTRNETASKAFQILLDLINASKVRMIESRSWNPGIWGPTVGRTYYEEFMFEVNMCQLLHPDKKVKESRTKMIMWTRIQSYQLLSNTCDTVDGKHSSRRFSSHDSPRRGRRGTNIDPGPWESANKKYGLESDLFRGKVGQILTNSVNPCERSCEWGRISLKP